MALTPTELNTLRTSAAAHKLYLSISIPRVLLTATAASPGFAATSIPYSAGSGSGFADISAGQTLKVVTGLTTEYIRIRSVSGSQSSGTLTVAANSITWGTGAALTVLEEYRLWPLLPRFTAAGEFYKDWDIAYGSQNNAINPVCIADHHAGWLVADSYSYTEDLSRSYPLATALIDSYSLELIPAAGVTVTDHLDGTFTVEITAAGQYWQKATVTDTLLTSQVTYRRVFVHDAASPPGTALEINTLSGATERGWNLEATLHGALTAADVPDNTLVLLWQEQRLGGVESYPGAPPTAANVLFTGYVQRSRLLADWNEATLELTARSANQVLVDLYIASISLEATLNATTWYEYIHLLSTGRAVHHLLKWHSTTMEVCSVLGLDEDYNVLRYFAEMQAGNIEQTALGLLQNIFSTLSADKTGQLVVRRAVQLRSDTERNALATGWTATKQDMSRIEAQPQSSGASSIFVSGISRLGVSVSFAKPILSRAPGQAYGLGNGPREYGNLVLPDQASANILSGRLLAREQMPYSRLIWQDLGGGYLPALDVTQAEWVGLTLDGSESGQALSCTDWRCLVTAIEVQVDSAAGALTLQVEVEPEAYGFSGITEVWPTEPPDAVADIPLPPLPEIEPLPPLALPEILQPPTLGNLVAWGEAMGVYSLESAGDAGWLARNGPVSGGSQPGCIDPWRAEAGTLGGLAAAQTPLWRCATGAIWRSLDGGQQWQNVTPLDDPPNTWSDATAPTVAALDFMRVTASPALAGAFYVPATWQAAGGEWRSWLLATSDYGRTWQYLNSLVITTPTDTLFTFADGLEGWVGITDNTPRAYPYIISGGRFYAAPGVENWVPIETKHHSGAYLDEDHPAYSAAAADGYITSEFPFGTVIGQSYGYYGNNQRWVYIAFGQKASCSGITVTGLWGRFWASGAGGTLSEHHIYLYGLNAPDGVGGVLAGQAVFGGDLVVGDITVNGTVTNKHIGVQMYTFPKNNYNHAGCAIYTLLVKGLTTGVLQQRIIYANASYVLAIADDELVLLDNNLSLLASLGSCTNAEYDAGVASAACFTPLDSDQVVFVYGRFDLTAGQSGLTGIWQVIVSVDGGQSWTGVEQSWGDDHCGSFLAGYDSGSGTRYWAIRNAASAQLYSDIGGLTYISDIAAFRVLPDNLHILDGQTMVVAGQSAAGASIVFESYDGGAGWTDITGALPITGVNKVSYA